MRIGIDCRTILNPKFGEKAGVGHYTYCLVKNLLKLDKKNEYVLLFDYRMVDAKEFKRPNVKIKYFPFSQYKKFLPFGYSHMLISSFLAREKLDIYHAPANVIPYTYTGDSVITVHDLAIYKYPSWFPKGQEFSTKILCPKSINKAKRIIAVSESTKRSVINLFKMPANKISVIYEGFFKDKIPSKVEEKRILDRYKIDSEKYILYVGTIEPRKNIVNIIRAFDLLNKRRGRKFKDYRLVIAGGKGWKYEDVFKAIKNSPYSHRIKYLNYIPHKDKLALINRAECFVFPSLWEGFGLPVLEAMSLGTPVVSSNVSSLPEVAGKAAQLVNPRQVSEISKALNDVLSKATLRNKMRKTGLEQAKKFSWDKCAKETLKVYREVYKEVQAGKKAKKEEKDKKEKEKKQQKDRKKKKKKNKKKGKK